MKQPGLFDAPPPPRTKVTLHQGDCLEVMPTLAAKSVDYIFCDLPYGCLKQHKWDVPIDLSLFWPQCERVKTDTSPVVLTANFKFSTLLYATNSKNFSYEWVYEKKLCSSPLLSKKRPLATHEMILVFYGSRRYTPQMRPESERINLREGWRSSKTSTNKFFKQKWVGSTRLKGEMYPRSVIRPLCESRKTWVHSTQKSVALMRYLLETYTSRGDTVLDPCAGSGSLAIAALQTGRHSVCIEKDSTYFEVMRKRVAEERERLGHK